jgi:limonene-1,2-epoxide hydrolase
MTVIALLAGCGGGDSDEAAAADVVSEFLTALAEEDGGRACAQLTAAARQVVSTAATEVPGVSAPECAAVLERIATLIPGGSRAELRRLPEGISADDARIQSDTAIVTVPGARLPIELTNSDRGWLITDQTMRRLLELER